MDKLLFSVRDSASQVFAPPFVAPSQGFAMRMFRDAIADKNSDNMMSKHPEDFELYIIGSYSEDSGVLTAVSPVTMVARGLDVVQLAN